MLNFVLMRSAFCRGVGYVMVTHIASNLKVYKINIIDCKKFRSRKVLVILTHCFSVVF